MPHKGKIVTVEATESTGRITVVFSVTVPRNVIRSVKNVRGVQFRTAGPGPTFMEGSFTGDDPADIELVVNNLQQALMRSLEMAGFKTYWRDGPEDPSADFGFRCTGNSTKKFVPPDEGFEESIERSPMMPESVQKRLVKEALNEAEQETDPASLAEQVQTVNSLIIKISESLFKKDKQSKYSSVESELYDAYKANKALITKLKAIK